jgi:hypothetical protein
MPLTEKQLDALCAKRIEDLTGAEVDQIILYQRAKVAAAKVAERRARLKVVGAEEE